jgi:hypothetical protein
MIIFGEEAFDDFGAAIGDSVVVWLLKVSKKVLDRVR